MDKFGMNLGKSLLKSHIGGSSHHDPSAQPHAGKPYSSSDFMKDAKTFYSTKDVHQLDPRAMEFAATKIQAGWKGYQVRKSMKKN